MKNIVIFAFVADMRQYLIVQSEIYNISLLEIKQIITAVTWVYLNKLVRSNSFPQYSTLKGKSHQFYMKLQKMNFRRF